MKHGPLWCVRTRLLSSLVWDRKVSEMLLNEAPLEELALPLCPGLKDLVDLVRPTKNTTK